MKGSVGNSLKGKMIFIKKKEIIKEETQKNCPRKGQQSNRYRTSIT